MHDHFSFVYCRNNGCNSRFCQCSYAYLMEWRCVLSKFLHLHNKTVLCLEENLFQWIRVFFSDPFNDFSNVYDSAPKPPTFLGEAKWYTTRVSWWLHFYLFSINICLYERYSRYNCDLELYIFISRTRKWN